MTKKPILAVLALTVAIILAIGSLVLSLPTVAPAVEAKGLWRLWTSVGCGVLAATLVSASWSRVPRESRFTGATAVAIGLLGLTCSASRLLM